MALPVNLPASTFSLDLNGAVLSAPPSIGSPIDLFYQSRSEALSLGGGGSLASSDRLRALALVPLFAGAEMYFRRVLSKCVEVCPVCFENAGTQQVAFGAQEVLAKSERAFAIGEHQGFTSEGEIAKRSQKILGIDVNRDQSLKGAIAEFEALCHLRHAIVHSSGELMYLNRRALEIGASGRLVVSVPLKEFQEVIGKVSNVVQAYNGYLAQELARRWIKQGILSGKWAADRRIFAKLMDVFWSITDKGALTNYKPLYSAAIQLK